MRSAWFRKLGKSMPKKPSLRAGRHSRRALTWLPTFETCEIRLMPATISWVSAVGRLGHGRELERRCFFTAASDDVVISQAGSNHDHATWLATTTQFIA